MHFTYAAYRELIEKLRVHGYTFASYHDWEQYDRSVILRHDIDYSIPKALNLARIEKELGVKSTYFVLLTSDLYNIFSKKNAEMLREISRLGHEIGIHFDESRYTVVENMEKLIVNEAMVLGKVIEKKVSTVSMHRPSKDLLEKNLQIKGLINSYSDVFFGKFKYLSDSRRRWREAVEDIIEADKYMQLHILTHAFWYNDAEKDIYESVRDFIEAANKERYVTMAENITDLESIYREGPIRIKKG